MLDEKAIFSIIDETIQNNSILGGLLSSQDREFIIKNSHVRTAEAGEILCQQHQDEAAFYLIIEGRARITVDVKGVEYFLSELGEGELVGEIGAFYMIPRTASVTVAMPSVILEIPGDVSYDLIVNYPDLREKVRKRSKDRAINAAICGVPLFKQLSEHELLTLCHQSSLVSAKKNDQLIVEGNEGQGLYVMSLGVARVHVNVRGKEEDLATLRAGDFFGERSLLTGEMRAASISAVTDIQLVLIDGEFFKSLVDENEELKQMLEHGTINYSNK